MNFEQARLNMVEQQIRPWEVLDQSVLETITAIPRDEFVPPTYRTLAYSDTAIPLGYGEEMMTPKLEARIVQSLNLRTMIKSIHQEILRREKVKRGICQKRQG